MRICINAPSKAGTYDLVILGTIPTTK